MVGPDWHWQALENSEDGFAVVAEHFGRGLLSGGARAQTS